MWAWGSNVRHDPQIGWILLQENQLNQLSFCQPKYSFLMSREEKKRLSKYYHSVSAFLRSMCPKKKTEQLVLILSWSYTPLCLLVWVSWHPSYPASYAGLVFLTPTASDGAPLMPAAPPGQSAEGPALQHWQFLLGGGPALWHRNSHFRKSHFLILFVIAVDQPKKKKAHKLTREKSAA